MYELVPAIRFGGGGGGLFTSMGSYSIPVNDSLLKITMGIYHFPLETFLLLY